MRGDGCKKFMARMAEDGLKSSWLLALRTKPRPSSDCGLKGGKLKGAMRELRQWGIIKPMGLASDKATIWGPGQTYDLAAVIALEIKQKEAV
jgi:hypothetical protein